MPLPVVSAGAHWLGRQYKGPQWVPGRRSVSDSEPGGPAGPRLSIPSMKGGGQPCAASWKLVLVGDVQCGKTAMLQVLAKDCYPEVGAVIRTVGRGGALLPRWLFHAS